MKQFKFVVRNEDNSPNAEGNENPAAEPQEENNGGVEAPAAEPFH